MKSNKSRKASSRSVENVAILHIFNMSARVTIQTVLNIVSNQS